MRWAHKPTLSEMQATVGGYVEHVALDGRTHLWLNEEGKLEELPVNNAASNAWHCYFGPTDMIVGNVLFEIWGRTRHNTLLVEWLEQHARLTQEEGT